jgi:hypothetical protein
MDDHEEMAFENDRGPEPKDTQDKTKTQEGPGNKGGYQGTNRSEREQVQRGLDQKQARSKTDDDDDDEDVNWKVVRGRKSGTPPRKAYTKGNNSATENATDPAAGTETNKNKQTNNTTKLGGTAGGEGQSSRGGEHACGGGRPTKDDNQHAGGVRSSTNSGTIEVRFMIDVNRRRDFNLCMRLREFITQARVMDPTFSILPLGENGGETITKPDEWPNTKEGIDKYYSHWSRSNNVAGKMKIVTALSMMQLKNQSGSFLTYLKRKGVHINYAQLGMVETVTLGWIGQAHPSFGCRDETKHRIRKLMEREYPTMQYALFPRAFHYVTDKNVRMTTRGIALQIMKHDDVPVEKFREELVRKWQNLDDDSGNPLGTQYLVPVGRGANLGSAVMRNLFLRQNHFLRNTRMQLVHNLNDMDEIISLDLNEHVDIDPEYLTLRNILRSFKVRGNPVFQSIERTAETGTYKFLYHAAMEKYVKDLMSGLDEHIRQVGDWATCDTHYRYHVHEKVTPHSQLTRANENQDFWSSYAVKLSGSAAPTMETDKTMNAPPPRSIRNVQVSYSAIAQKNTGSKAAATASTTSETAESSTSTISDARNDEDDDDDGMQRLKRKLVEIDQERSQFKTQQQKVEDDVSTLTQSMTKMGNDILNIRQDMAKLNQQLHEITTLLKQNIGQAGKIREPTIKSPTRKRRGKKDMNSFSSNEDRSGSWASDCDSEDEKRKRQAKGAAGIEDMVVESGILGNM